MRGRDARAALASVVAALQVACAANPAPLGWRRDPTSLQREAYGGWIELRCKKDLCGSGELIAVEQDSVVLLTGAGVVEVPTSSVTKATLTAYRTYDQGTAAWMTLGALSTISHGMLLILTLPLGWLLIGGTAVAEESRAGLVRYPQQKWAAFRPYARFPQGLPADLDQSSLELPATADERP